MLPNCLRLMIITHAIQPKVTMQQNKTSLHIESSLTFNKLGIQGFTIIEVYKTIFTVFKYSDSL